MGAPIVIVHGWSDSSKSFRGLAEFFRANLSAEVSVIDLADWLSMNDEVTYKDLRTALDEAWRAQPNLHADNVKARVVTHSTGALVVRDWLTTYFRTPAEAPVSHLVMLAPANFGSPLAHLGESLVGQIFKGWKTGGQTGQKLLQGLEMGSDYTWGLADRDVFASTLWFGDGGILASVLVGMDGYPGLKGVANLAGSDGTVCVSTASLNAARATLEFPPDGGAPTYSFFPAMPAREVPLRVMKGYDHGSITVAPAADTPYGQSLLGALSALPSDYAGLRADFQSGTQHDYAQAVAEFGDHAYYHAYQNTVVRAFDHLGNVVAEYAVKFDEFARGARKFDPNGVALRFQREFLPKVHNYTGNQAYRSLYVDVTGLGQLCIAGDVFLTVDPSPRVTNQQPVGYAPPQPIPLDASQRDAFFQGNRTLLLDVTYPREMIREDVFNIAPA